jgi:hypothetical protein
VVSLVSLAVLVALVVESVRESLPVKLKNSLSALLTITRVATSISKSVVTPSVITVRVLGHLQLRHVVTVGDRV